MIKKFLLTSLLCIACLITISCPNPDPPPDLDPIHLGISNFTQDTSCWCWAAVSQQIIYWKTGSYVNQCVLVNSALYLDYCCFSPLNCCYAGNWNHIQALIYYFGCSYSTITLPANPMIVYNTLKAGSPIIVFLQTSPQVGHFVILEGMEWNNNIPKFYINDPMSYFTQPWSFEQLSTYWTQALVVY